MDTKKIYFENTIVEKGRIDLNVIIMENESKMEHKVYFELSKSFKPNNNLIGIALSTLCGKEFNEIKYDIPLCKEVIDGIANFTGARVIAEVSNEENDFKLKHSNYKGILLNFSGGFDSLALLCLIPKSTKLVAIDFGGWFAREEEFFKKFKPYIVKTNFRLLKLDRNHWTYMGVAAILYSEYLEIKYNIFGTVLEDTPYHVMKNPSAGRNIHTLPFSIANLKDIRFANGLSEVGTAIVISHYKPEFVNRSLISLSSPKTEKRYRKEVITDIVSKRFNRRIEFDRTLPPDQKIEFGTSFAVDFIAIYELKHAGLEIVNNTVINIPPSIIKLSEELSLNYYERLNTNFIGAIPEEYRAEYISKVAEAGIMPYTQQDWEELELVVQEMSKYYKILS